MYLNIIFSLALSIVILCPGASALQMDSAENGIATEQPNAVKTFLNSDFVRTSVWPGIGPFHLSSNNRLVDPSGNRLTYSTVGPQISSCQLEMRGGANEAQCMLNLQMSVDFLLESLGVKPEQIHTVNTELSKNSKLLMGNNYNPVHTTIAPFLVSLQNLGVNEGNENSIYRLVVVNTNLASGNLETNAAEENKNISSEKTQENSATEVAIVNNSVPNSAKAVVKTTDKVATSSVPRTKGLEKSDEVAQSKSEPVNPDISDEENKVESVINVQKNTGAEVEVTKSASVPKATTKDDQLKNDFCKVIEDWQKLKKVAVKERDTKLLTQSLAGKSLIRQTDAIKWLVNNHKYYEMTPGGAKVEKVSPLVANMKYAVYAEVKEKTKYVDEDSGQVIKTTDDTYKVNYTIEKIADKWLIVDSTLMKNTPEKNLGKTGSQKAGVQKANSAKSTKPGTKAIH